MTPLNPQDSFPSPSSNAPITAASMSPYLRGIAGPAWASVRQSEARLRETWHQLCALQCPARLQPRRAQLCERAKRLVEGPQSLLGGMVSRLPGRWDEGSEPLRGFLAEVRAVTVAAAGLQQLIGAITLLRADYDTLVQTYSTVLPVSWTRLVTNRGLSATTIDDIQSPAEAMRMHRRLSIVRTELAQRHETITHWLREGAEGTLDSGSTNGVPTARLEERYYILASLGTSDRESQLKRNAATLRSHVRRHLQAVVSPDDEPWLLLARQYAALKTGPIIHSEEMSIYSKVIGSGRMSGEVDLPAEADLERNGRFATAVDADTVVIRPGILTPLAVLPAAGPREAQVVAQLPSTWEALEPDEAGAVHQHFQLQATDSFWWRTLHPADFETERLKDGLEIGRRIARGQVVADGWDPRQRPTGSSGLFSIFSRPEESYLLSLLRDPWGPVAEHGTSPQYESEAMRATVVRFPGFSKELVWLWSLTPRFQNPQQAHAMARSATLLRTLEREYPGVGAEVIHHGGMQTAQYSGAYVATKMPIGLALADIFSPQRARTIATAEYLVTNFTLDLTEALCAAHRVGWCTGVLAPSLLRARLCITADEISVRAVILALPFAGSVPEQSRADLWQQFRAEDLIILGETRSRRYKGSKARDLVGLGALMMHLLHLSQCDSSGVKRVASNLVDGWYPDGDAALAELKALAGM
jgi:hypothetical protein